MKGNAAIVRKLNEALTNELTAIDHYLVHSGMLDLWGFTRLAKRERDASIDEMKHAGSRDLFRRILATEEEHIDGLETQLEPIAKVGVENHQRSQMGTAD